MSDTINHLPFGHLPFTIFSVNRGEFEGGGGYLFVAYTGDAVHEGYIQHLLDDSRLGGERFAYVGQTCRLHLFDGTDVADLHLLPLLTLYPTGTSGAGLCCVLHQPRKAQTALADQHTVRRDSELRQRMLLAHIHDRVDEHERRTLGNPFSYIMRGVHSRSQRS